MKFVISLEKAMNAEYGGTTRSGPSGPGESTPSLPDFSIYYAPPEKKMAEREQEAAANRQTAMRHKHRGFWGTPPALVPKLRYEGEDIAPYAEHDVKLKAKNKATIKGAKLPDASRKRKQSRKLGLRRM